MSYANGTTHYNLPQTVGTDKRDWIDTNEAFASVDAALYTASETASGAASDIVTLGGRVTDLETASGTQAQDIVDIKADILSQGGAITRLDGKIDGVKADALDMICAVDEGTAQVATVAVTEGQYFRYNDVLYIATDDIAIGDTIVPNTNCKATNVATELLTNSGILATIVSSLTYKAGDTVNLTGMLCSGRGNASGYVVAFIPLDKPIDADNASLSLTSAYAFAPSSTASTSPNLEDVRIYSTGIGVTISFTESVTANTPCVLQLDGVITFS